MDDVKRLNVETDLTDTLPVLKRRRLSESIDNLKRNDTGEKKT